MYKYIDTITVFMNFTLLSGNIWLKNNVLHLFVKREREK